MNRVGFFLLVIIGSQLFPQNPEWNVMHIPEPYPTSFLSVLQAIPGSSNRDVFNLRNAATEFKVQVKLTNANTFSTSSNSIVGNGNIFCCDQNSETERITFLSISSPLWSGLSGNTLFSSTKEDWKPLSPTYFYNEYQKAHLSIIVFSQSTRSRA